MKFDSSLTPESDEERHFMEQIAIARNEALNAGVSQQEVARIFLAFSEGLLGDFDEDVGSSGGSDEKSLCPACGVVISDYSVPGIGEDIAVEPCGCRMAFDELPESIR